MTTRAGRTFAGNACICAIPAPCLNKIRWNPPLPVQQHDHAEELQYARIVKIAVFFHSRFWDKKWRRSKGSGFSMFSNRVSDFCFESTNGQEGPEGIICSYAIGDKADDLASETGRSVAEWISGDLCLALRRTDSKTLPKTEAGGNRKKESGSLRVLPSRSMVQSAPRPRAASWPGAVCGRASVRSLARIYGRRKALARPRQTHCKSASPRNHAENVPGPGLF